MIWLVSYPRSGNTFFRNVLYEVYGLESSTYHHETAYPVAEDYKDYPVVKTHLMPEQLVPNDPNIPVVYLVRDGRDSVVSLAHHRKDIVEPGTDFRSNLYEATLAEGGSFFSGWSEHVRQWMPRADVVIRFEDLIRDPLAEVAKLQPILNLPEPDAAKLPNFQTLKHGIPQYGSGKHLDLSETDARELAGFSFRKGKVGSWKEEMTAEEHHLFWREHGTMLAALGYNFAGDIPDTTLTPQQFSRERIELKQDRQYRVLVEASKLLMPFNDGVKRYLKELLRECYRLLDQPNSGWAIDLYLAGEIVPLKDARHLLEGPDPTANADHPVGKNWKANAKDLAKAIIPRDTYNSWATRYRQSGLKYRMHLWRMRANRKRASEKLGKQLAEYDLVHLPLPQHYEPFEGLKANYITTVHDLTTELFPEYHVDRNIQLAKQGMDFLRDRNSAVIAISQSTREDVLRLHGVGAHAVHTILEAADTSKFQLHQRNSHLRDLTYEKFGLPAAPYILCLSTLEPRKNLKNTILGFKQLLREHPDLETHLVIVGNKGWKSESLFRDADLQSDRILFTGFVADEFLPVLYAEALALCYVSYYEGFGLPLVEAMSCRTPVIYGNNSSMIEVAGDGGLPAEPDDPASIAAQMARVATDPDFREQLAAKAFAHAAQFSWRKTALQTLEAYRSTIASHSD